MSWRALSGALAKGLTSFGRAYFARLQGRSPNTQMLPRNL